MQSDTANGNPTTTATTEKIRKIIQRLWAILGLKMALDRLRDLGYYVVAIVDDKNVATITIQFGKLAVDLDSGTVNAHDIMAVITKLDARIKE